MSVKSKLAQGGDGTAIPAGFVGEVVTSSKVQSVGASSTGATIGTFSGITKGRWRFDFKGTAITADGIISKIGYIVQLTSNSSLNPNIGDSYSTAIETSCGSSEIAAISNSVSSQTSTSFVLDIASDSTFYLRCAYSVTGGGSIGVSAFGQATRIA
jgi:hypothetical protein